MYYLGIDISKKSLTVPLLGKEGKVIANSHIFPCTSEGIEKLVDRISSYVPGEEVPILRELGRLRHCLRKVSSMVMKGFSLNLRKNNF